MSDKKFTDQELQADILILKDNIGLNEDTIAFSAIQHMNWKLSDAEKEEGYLSVTLIGCLKSFPMQLATYTEIRNRYINWHRSTFFQVGEAPLPFPGLVNLG